MDINDNLLKDFTIIPCPFCGYSDVEVETLDIEDREGTPRALICDNCGVRGPVEYCPENNFYPIVRKWNERN